MTKIFNSSSTPHFSLIMKYFSFDICFSQISFYIYITYTKSFCKLYFNFLFFTVLNKLLSILLYNEIYHNWNYSSLHKTHEQR